MPAPALSGAAAAACGGAVLAPAAAVWAAASLSELGMTPGVATGAVAAPAFPAAALDAYHWLIRVFTRPDGAGDLLSCSLVFVVLMVTICAAVESLNPEAWRGAERRRLIRRELLLAVPSAMLAPAIAVSLMAHVYPRIHGHHAPVFPASLPRFAWEVLLWVVTFDLAFYAQHRLMHTGPLYTWAHKAHHSFRQLTAFSAQTNSLPDTVATTLAESAVFLLFPISFATHSLLGVILFAHAAFIHDSHDWADGGFHREHHANPDKNFGFLGLMDLLAGTVHWGQTRDGLPVPKYAARFDALSRVLTPWRLPQRRGAEARRARSLDARVR